MGCGISRYTLEEAGHVLQIKSFGRRSDYKDDTDSLNSKHRKSTSSATSEGGGFLRRVIGSNEKERGVDRDIEPTVNDHHGRKSSFSSSLRMSKEISGKQNEDEFVRPSDADECASILHSQGSPSFRVYVDREQFPFEDREGDEDQSAKGPETSLSKRGVRKGRGFRGLREVMQRGGSVGMKNFFNGSARCHNSASSPTQDTRKLIAKVA
ncbi:hypothetical protein JCGZ_26837 [Jatropha curcas]|uniref:Uncharacterized protein n=1 Tax=Jatropha curcas TaxID=180498 RepID=A0A067LCK4_JATCU|nr:uncharacterized protein LOC110009123 [Jatropha curcas]KDP41819.1 hypothetical protein JCGZ_26837 [Jatropha curcas]